jgi:acetyl-CoA carboxylase biotin carboxylase subunit
MFEKVLIANRGEIALRVMRALRELSIPSVAVFSEADRSSLHMRYADEAYLIGPAPSVESYLRIDRILDVAERAGADAIHPGYGFLAENGEFALACEDAGITFIGPDSRAMKLLGDKTEARKTMIEAGVPVIPGTTEEIRDPKKALETARGIGFPVLLKAAAGGGGKGMRVVREESEFEGAHKGAAAEAGSAFGDPRIYIEKFIERPRHIEFQIVADHHGNVVHLGERECSIQRRHQKMVEESPSPLMTEELREEMGETACRVVKASGYRNAGTVEFLVDSDRTYYFLEVNARLQVEHPVTELVTGFDIVKEQLHVASGGELRIHQEDVVLRGAAVECRISAEDPDNDFLPSIGTVTRQVEPQGPGIRVDSCVFNGMEVPVYYDPLISKLLVWAGSREEAIVRMRRALSEYRIMGVKTGIPFLKRVMLDQRFVGGTYDTSFLDTAPPELACTEEEIAALAAALYIGDQEPEVRGDSTSRVSPWRIAGRRDAHGT